MGSQSVTNFSDSRKKRIEDRLRAFDPDAPDAARRAAEAGAEAIGSLAKFGGFSLALTSASAQAAANTIADLIDGIKAERSGVLEKYGVDPSDKRPYAALVAGLREKFNENLSESSRKTEAAPAAADALGATILEVIKDRFPRKREPTEVTRDELRQAIASAPAEIFSRVFTRSLLTSLVKEAFDAARGKSPPDLIDAVMTQLEPRINDLAIRLTKVGRK